MPKIYDTVIVGAGISGAMLARDLTKEGQQILLLEKGGYHKFLGNHPTLVRIADRKGFRYTKEHLFVASGITVGGSSVISAGTAFHPPKGFFRPWGIDLEQELNEAEKEANITILPDELIGKGNLHLLDVGNKLGQEWVRFPKFVDPIKCIPNCSSCMLGCKHNAKFTARTLIEEAMTNGLMLQKKKVERVIIEGGKAIGVKPKRGHIIKANRIIVSAGGIHSTILLQKSGIKKSGKGFFMDPMIFTYGVATNKAHRTTHDMPMVVGTYKFQKEEGILQSAVTDPWGMFLLSLVYRKNPLRITKFRHYPRLMGIMTKIQDDKNGTISSGRFGITISKKLTIEDRKRLERGKMYSKEVLLEAGAKKLFSSPIRGAHPGGTNSINEVVNTNFQTEYPNLYVCDSSILPRSLGAPLVITLMAFAKKLAKQIINES
ncbi:MAG: GMC family oxidoreductase N-terminal domain-containing protein [Promethearchaeota archaeon]